jgi:hypothetical protein
MQVGFMEASMATSAVNENPHVPLENMLLPPFWKS